MKRYKILKPNKLILLILALVPIATALGSDHLVQARNLEAQINALNQQNVQNRQAEASLEASEKTLADKIAGLQNEINAVQVLVNENEAKNNAVKAEIASAETELQKQKDLLGKNIRAMYVEGDISTLEMLASSKDLSDFVDKEQYRISVKDKIQTSVKQVNDLKFKLTAQQEELQELIADHKAMQSRISQQKAEQDTLLNLNQEQQASYNQKISNNNSEIVKLRQQQMAENSRLFGGGSGGGVPAGVPGGGGYPARWANLPIDSVFDSWGMYNRQCVSYTAWKVASTGRYMPYWGGRGNAKQWDDNARGAGIPVDSNPRAGDVAISNSGFYGHTMYVEKVSGDGSIYVSDYNQQFDGNYREYWINGATVSARGLVFIHF